MKDHEKLADEVSTDDFAIALIDGVTERLSATKPAWLVAAYLAAIAVAADDKAAELGDDE